MNFKTGEYELQENLHRYILAQANNRNTNNSNYRNMVTMKFSATKSETLFLTPTIAVEQNNSETAIRFALWHGVFSVEVSKSYKTVKAK